MNQFRHLAGLLGRVISPLQGLYLHRTAQHRKTRTNIHALGGIRTREPRIEPWICYPEVCLVFSLCTQEHGYLKTGRDRFLPTVSHWMLHNTSSWYSIEKTSKHEQMWCWWLNFDSEVYDVKLLFPCLLLALTVQIECTGAILRLGPPFTYWY
jgi:hypothetical protein